MSEADKEIAFFLVRRQDEAILLAELEENLENKIIKGSFQAS